MPNLSDRRRRIPQAVAAPAVARSIGILDLSRRFWNSLSSQHLSFILVCIYLIIEYNRPQQIWSFLAPIPWAQLAVVAGLTFTAVDPQSTRPPFSTLALLALFACCVIAAATAAQLPDRPWTPTTTVLSWIVVVIFVVSTVSNRDRLIVFLLVYYLVNFKMAQHGFRTWAARGFGMASWGVTGSPGWFSNSGEFGMQMAMLTPLLVSHLFAVRRTMTRGLLFAACTFLVMVVGSVIASNSRGAILGLAVLAAWLLIQSKNRIRAALSIAVAFALVLAVTPDETLDRFSTAGDDKTSVTRLTYWKQGLESIKEHPVLGVGLGNWVPYIERRNQAIFSDAGRAEVMHNTPLEVATELGLLGLLLFVATIVYIYAANASSLARARRVGDGFLASTASGLNGMLLVYLVTSFFMSVFQYPYFWVLLALTVACAQVQQPRGRQVGPAPRPAPVRQGG